MAFHVRYEFLMMCLCLICGARCIVQTVTDKPRAVGQELEVVMASMIFLSLCVAAEVFLLHCLFHFRQELDQMRQSESGQWIASPNANVVTFRLRPPDSQPLRARNERATKNHNRAA